MCNITNGIHRTDQGSGSKGQINKCIIFNAVIFTVYNCTTVKALCAITSKTNALF